MLFEATEFVVICSLTNTKILLGFDVMKGMDQQANRLSIWACGFRMKIPTPKNGREGTNLPGTQ